MEVLEIILGVALALVAIIIIALVLLQQGRRSGINGTISGAADTFLSKNKARTVDALLKRLTAIFGIVFVVLAVAETIVSTVLTKK